MRVPGPRGWLKTLALVGGLAWLALGRSVAAQEPAPVWQALGAPAGRLTLLVQQSDTPSLFATSVSTTYREADTTQWRDSGAPQRSDALYRSDDLGVSWKPATNNLPHGQITALFADPQTGHLLAGLRATGNESDRRDGLWRSEDGGATWRFVQVGRNDLHVRRIIRSADGGPLFFAATDGAEFPTSYVYASHDGGRTWQGTEVLRSGEQPQTAVRELMTHPTDPARLFFTTEGGELWESRDTGMTWMRVALPVSFAAAGRTGAALLAIETTNPASMLLARNMDAGPEARVVVASSRDGGATWRMQGDVSPVHGDLTAFASLPDGAFLLATSAGSYRSNDGGASWQLLEGPLSSGSVSAFLTPANSPGAVLAASGYGLFASRDGGGIWQPLGTGLPANLPLSLMLTDVRRPGFVLGIPDQSPIAGAPQPPAILRSTDNGRTWTAAAPPYPISRVDSATLDPADPDRLHLAADEHFLTSANGGLTWQETPLPPGSRPALTVALTDPSTLYLGGAPLLRSTDGGSSWQAAPVAVDGATQPGPATGIVVDALDARHIWAGLESGGVYETRDGGSTWRAAGLDGRPVRWLTSVAQPEGSGIALTLYAGVPDDGVYRWRSAASGWEPASQGLPPNSTVLSLLADVGNPEVMWATRDGGGLYRSVDSGAQWLSVGDRLGENLVLALAGDSQRTGGVLAATASAGLWVAEEARQASSNRAAPDERPQRVDARVEIVWPHDFAPVTTAQRANIGLRLFEPGSLTPLACDWQPEVTIWQATGHEPAAPIGQADQRTVNGAPFPVWELNDVDVSRANNPEVQLYFLVRVAGVETSTSVWAHGADPRTIHPYQDAPSGTSAGAPRQVDTRIQVVWPHDGAGRAAAVAEAPLANISVALFEHGTRLSAPATWRPRGLTLYGAWDQEIAQPLARRATMQLRKAGAITYPVWEFTNIPVARAADPGSKLYLWVMVDGVETYPSIWAHGADARTLFPAMDQPIAGCSP